jgi:hypothetical protein
VRSGVDEVRMVRKGRGRAVPAASAAAGSRQATGRAEGAYRQGRTLRR